MAAIADVRHHSTFSPGGGRGTVGAAGLPNVRVPAI
jgi:hypothetical protein